LTLLSVLGLHASGSKPLTVFPSAALMAVRPRTLSDVALTSNRRDGVVDEYRIRTAHRVRIGNSPFAVVRQDDLLVVFWGTVPLYPFRESDRLGRYVAAVELSYMLVPEFASEAGSRGAGGRGNPALSDIVMRNLALKVPLFGHDPEGA
jgi:hypothetical protein